MSPVENPKITMVSGNMFPLLNPTPDDVRLIDIAHSLGLLARFNGHTAARWSVAEHSVLVALILRDQGHSARLQMAGLFHDAAEAYIGDMPTPIKWALEAIDSNSIAAWRDLEREIEDAIWKQFNIVLTDAEQAIVKVADTIALATEKRDLMPPIQWPGALPEPYHYHVEVAILWALWHHRGAGSDILAHDHTPECTFHHVYENLVLERLAEC